MFEHDCSVSAINAAIVSAEFSNKSSLRAHSIVDQSLPRRTPTPVTTTTLFLLVAVHLQFSIPDKTPLSPTLENLAWLCAASPLKAKSKLTSGKKRRAIGIFFLLPPSRNLVRPCPYCIEYRYPLKIVHVRVSACEEARIACTLSRHYFSESYVLSFCELVGTRCPSFYFSAPVITSARTN